MSKKNNGIDNLLEEIENFTNVLKNFEEYFSNPDSTINQKLKEHNDKIYSLDNELNNSKEITSKNYEYLLLSLESYEDKLKQIQNKNNEKYFELISILKNENLNKITDLSE